MIYTSYFANLKNLPANIVPIAICGKIPKFYNGLVYKKLAPKYPFFKVWKEMRDCGNPNANSYYTAHFYMEVLAPLKPAAVINDLIKMAGSVNIALICYEKPDSFCHRHLVADWLNANGYKVYEWGAMHSLSLEEAEMQEKELMEISESIQEINFYDLIKKGRVI